jgi:hypothetical protein
MKWGMAAVWVALASPVVAADLPLPPLPPSSPPSATAAPVPDNDFTPPPSAANAGPTVGLKFFRSQTFDPGLGFAPGSRYRSSEDRKPVQTPGISVSVPLN